MLLNAFPRETIDFLDYTFANDIAVAFKSEKLLDIILDAWVKAHNKITQEAGLCFKQ